MIDFRYHLVSIIAIFFALAAGIVLGAGPLGDEADENLGEQLAEFRQQNDELREERDQVQSELDLQKQFIDEMAPRSVSGELRGRHVAVLALPGSEDDDVDAVQEVLDQSGAVTDLRMRIEPGWADPGSEDLLDELAATYVSSGISLDAEADGHTRGATVLASSVMARLDDDNTGTQTLEPLNTDTLAAYESGGLISMEEESASRASLAVVVAGDISGADAEERVQRLVSLAQEVDLAGEGVVVAGPVSTAEEGGVLAAIRDSDVHEDVSTVDSVTGPSGRVGVVFAMAQQAAGESGQYGLEGAPDGLIPPAPEIEQPSDDEAPPEDDPTDEPGSGEETGDGAANGEESTGDGTDDADVSEVGNEDTEGDGDDS